MPRAYKRTRIKTGPNSWINKTQRNDGTTFTSVSNKGGNTTTNISSRGVRKTQNNNGWVQRTYIPAWPKAKKSKTASKKSNSTSFFGTLLFGSSGKSKTTSSKASTKKTTSTRTKTYVASEEDAFIPIEQIPSACETLGGVLAEHAEILENEDDKMIVLAVREAIVVHVKKGIDENDRSTLNLIQECIDEIEKLKAKADDESFIRLYTSMLKVLVYIKRGYDYGVYKVSDEKESEFKLTWPMIVVIAIICFIIQMLMR